MAIFDVKHHYGATGDSLTDDSAAFLNAATDAARVAGTVYVPKGAYNVPTLVLPSGVTIEGDGEQSVLLNCFLTCDGSVASEIAFTAPAVAGATGISIPSLGLDNTWVRLASCINSQSPDAGIWQLGNLPSAFSNLAEFALIETGGASTATLSRGTLFPYSNTPGADTKAGQTTSVARVVTFHQAGRIRHLKFLGKNAAQNNVIQAKWCRDLVIEDVQLDSNNLTSRNIEMIYCLDCHIIGGKNIGRRTGVPTGSTANQLIISSCQDCDVDGMRFEAGNQCVDITYDDTGSSYRGGPSIECGASNCRATNMESEGFTDHEGSLRSFFDNCSSKGGATGFRIRSRGSSVRHSRATSRGGGGSGVLIMGAALFDSDVSHNRIDGYVFGVEFRSSEPGYNALRALLGESQALIQSNVISNTSAEGIICQDSPALATMIGPRILDNDVYNPGTNGILIGSYVNGAWLDRNRVYGVGSGQRGVRWSANVKRLSIGTLHVFNVNVSGFAMGGPSVSSFMTDTGTFPAAEAEAFLYIGDLFTDAATPYTGILRNTTAYMQPYAAGYGTAGATPLRGGRVLRGTGDPNSSVYAPLGSTYERADGGAGTSHYFKESAGTSNTGWVAK